MEKTSQEQQCGKWEVGPKLTPQPKTLQIIASVGSGKFHFLFPTPTRRDPNCAALGGGRGQDPGQKNGKISSDFGELNLVQPARMIAWLSSNCLLSLRILAEYHMCICRTLFC
jgi:hypothetical protein